MVFGFKNTSLLMSSASEQHIEAGPNESLRLKCSRIKTVLESSLRLNSSPFLSAFKVMVLLMVKTPWLYMAPAIAGPWLIITVTN